MSASEHRTIVASTGALQQPEAILAGEPGLLSPRMHGQIVEVRFRLPRRSARYPDTEVVGDLACHSASDIDQALPMYHDRHPWETGQHDTVPRAVRKDDRIVLHYADIRVDVCPVLHQTHGPLAGFQVDFIAQLTTRAVRL
jgi:hypothetical protein